MSPRDLWRATDDAPFLARVLVLPFALLIAFLLSRPHAHPP